MNKRTLIKGSAALLIVLVASLSTVRARQAWGEQQARSSYNSARVRVTSALVHGLHIGMLPAELAPFRARAGALDRASRPGTSLFWGSEESFYNRQTASFRVLLRGIKRTIVRVRGLTRSLASAGLSRLQRGIVRARTYDVNVAQAESHLIRNRIIFDRATTPGAYREVIASSATVRHTLDSTTSTRAREVSKTLRANGNTAAGVIQQADGETSRARDQLSLMHLITLRYAGLETQLSRVSASVHAQSGAFGAAVKESSLHALVDRIGRLYSRTIPQKLIVISTEAQWAHMYQSGTEVYNSPVTTGGPELPTDTGVFHIYEKVSPFVFHSPWGLDSPYYYPPTPVQFWMPFYQAEGLHDASWRSNFGPGSNFAPTDLGTGVTIQGTHGCVNLPYDAAAWVWDWAPIGTTVVVT